MKLTSKNIEVINEYFKTKPVLRAYLFGSYLTNNASETSDIDLLVDLDYDQRIGMKFIQMKLDLDQLLSKNVDLVSSNALSKYIKPIVDKEKLLIYERSN